jgi:preprotein translocase subunit YajC
MTKKEKMEAIKHLKEHIKNGDMVVCLSGGGGGNLDEWLRSKFKAN